MKLRAYSVYDTKAETWTPPFYQNTDGQATRMFSDLTTNKEHPMGKHPEDYTLFMVGTFDDSTGELENIAPLLLGNGVDFNSSQMHLLE